MLQNKLKQICCGALIGALLATASGVVLLKPNFLISTNEANDCDSRM